MSLMKMLVRQMVWIETSRMWAWACSECTWTYRPSGSPRGNSLDEMKQNYKRQRDKEFASHVCAEHPRTRSVRDDSRFSRRIDNHTNGAYPGGRGGEVMWKGHFENKQTNNRKEK